MANKVAVVVAVGIVAVAGEDLPDLVVTSRSVSYFGQRKSGISMEPS